MQRETIPGDGEHIDTFLTQAAAKQAMRQKIAESIDLKEYIADLDQFANEDEGRRDAAEFCVDLPRTLCYDTPTQKERKGELPCRDWEQ